MKQTELQLKVQGRPEDGYVEAFLLSSGLDLDEATTQFRESFHKDRPLPPSLLKDMGCTTCSTETPLISRVDSFPSRTKKRPNNFSDNQIYISCAHRARLAEAYLNAYQEWDDTRNGDPMLKTRITEKNNAWNNVNNLGCSHCLATARFNHSDQLELTRVVLDDQNPFEVPRSMLGGDILWGIAQYIGVQGEDPGRADKLDILHREAGTAYLTTKLLIDYLLRGENKYVTYTDTDTPIDLSLRKILSTIDGYDIINDRPEMKYSTLFIARELINHFIQEFNKSRDSNLDEDFKFALIALKQLESLSLT